MAPVRVAVAGSTGSIGTQTLEVVEAEGPDAYDVVGLGVGSSVDVVVEQARRHRPDVVAVADETARAEVSAALPGVDVVADQADLVEPADVVINGVVGFAGLPVTTATLRAGKRLGLANKESLIAAGPVVQPMRATPGAELVPVDSEHCAVHQCLRSSSGFADGSQREVDRIVLTASGGPFRGRTAADLAAVTVDDALAHPTWAMGPKITVDSSTLMNKGLEVIEAHELFGVGYDHIEVVVHPQSIVHSMVEFSDGSTIAQLSMPDMRLPIGYALGYPNRITTPFGRIDWSQLSQLDFEPPDLATFRCLQLAYDAGRLGGTAPAWLSAANEVAVDAFLSGLIRWNQIADVCVAVLDEHDGAVPGTVDDVIAADAQARRLAEAAVRQRDPR
ncbi:MAG: 1-deoxy-D-xylulose-5-phosphate reductoisomerase [Ilumatobacter sp.]|uniref:1-deoxy-D-xylulose-5-phosphate reductoisomerase n=1 Tax=Ilumatobacter sp. TaxID=1967498 RepID=UPI002637C5EF|nr:1-deoxy-D-xylulose-5-phosphate reductoisomerase [Ilumatobacter sp.]MDJ0768598.1 1-deoxy-D-xylulose-5-phosphate reductoisomerase [Ilumatobacter sp.]